MFRIRSASIAAAGSMPYRGMAMVICGSLLAGQLSADGPYPNYGFPDTNASFPAPSGFDSFQLEPPYNTENPFSLADLEAVSNGFDLFTGETFDGNGRTCSSCHLPEKNYNLSIEDFEALSPADQVLVLGGTNPHLENAEAVTEAVLFNINQSAGPGTEGTQLEPLGPFRSSMTIGGVGFHVLNNHVCRPGEFLPSGNGCPGGATGSNNGVDDGIRDMMLGWSGEGSLAEAFPWWDGADFQFADCDNIIAEFAADRHSLRDLDLALGTFALAAVKTHFPITQNREPGVDFDCPTKQQLLDMAVFQKWLGRRFELDINQMNFHDKKAQNGRNLFSTRVATCVACHVNAGASDTQGRVKSTPVPFLTMDGEEDFEWVVGHEELHLIGINKTSRNGSQKLELEIFDQFDTFDFPFDPGDHMLRSGPLGLGPRQGGFNVQSIIEAVRNKQFFHNNGVTGSIEDAIEFYFTDAFKQSQGGNVISRDFRRADPHDLATELTPQQAREFLGGDKAIADMGLFLRALSSLYAIADCERFVDEMADRVVLGLPTQLPEDHCRFALGDVKRMLGDVKVPKSFKAVLKDVDHIEKKLDALSKANKQKHLLKELEKVRKDLGRTRESIAKTPEIAKV